MNPNDSDQGARSSGILTGAKSATEFTERI